MQNIAVRQPRTDAKGTPEALPACHRTPVATRSVGAGPTTKTTDTPHAPHSNCSHLTRRSGRLLARLAVAPPKRTEALAPRGTGKTAGRIGIGRTRGSRGGIRKPR